MSRPSARAKARAAAETSVASDCGEHEDVAADDAAFPDLLSAAEVAALLRIGERALRDWDRRGWLAPTKVGRQKLYLAKEVLKILQHGTPKKGVRCQSKTDST